MIETQIPDAFKLWEKSCPKRQQQKEATKKQQQKEIREK